MRHVLALVLVACAADGDRDGVPDAIDRCTATAEGAPVATDGLVVGCAIDEDTRLPEVTASQWEVICFYAIAENADPVVCGDLVLPAATREDCVAANSSLRPDCTATLADWIACAGFEPADPCNFGVDELPDECAAISACY